DAQVVESGGELKGAHQPARYALLRREAGDVLAAIKNAAFLRRVEAGEQIEEGGLTGAVRADNAGDFIFAQRIGHVVDRDHRAEPLGDVLRPDDFRRAHVFLSLSERAPAHAVYARVGAFASMRRRALPPGRAAQ